MDQTMLLLSSGATEKCGMTVVVEGVRGAIVVNGMPDTTTGGGFNMTLLSFGVKETDGMEAEAEGVKGTPVNIFESPVMGGFNMLFHMLITDRSKLGNPVAETEGAGVEVTKSLPSGLVVSNGMVEAGWVKVTFDQGAGIRVKDGTEAWLVTVAFTHGAHEEDGSSDEVEDSEHELVALTLAHDFHDEGGSSVEIGGAEGKLVWIAFEDEDTGIEDEDEPVLRVKVMVSNCVAVE
jgi:hypothetical protein